MQNAKNGYMMRGLNLPKVSDLEKLLNSTERVEQALRSMRGLQVAITLLTSERVLISSKANLGKVFAHGSDALSFDRITEVQGDSSFGAGYTITISTAENIEELTYCNREDGQAFVNALREKVKFGSSPKAAPQDPLDAIKKLKELLDVGALTQEEFDLQKKRLLG